MAKQRKNGKNELDTILEQLKRSYGDESSASLDDELFRSSQSEEDAELNDILNKIFSSATVEVDTIQDDNENSPDADIEKEVAPTESAEIYSEENSSAEIEVDNILSVMFSSSAESKIDNGLTEDADTCEDDAYLEQPDLFDEVSDISVEKDDEIILESLTNQSENYLEKTFEDLNSIASDSTADFADTIENDERSENIVFSHKAEDEEAIAPVENNSTELSEDRIYISAKAPTDLSICAEFDSTEEYFEENCASDVPKDKEIEKETTKAYIILDQADYTFDPLQEALPRFNLAQDMAAINYSKGESGDDDTSIESENSQALDNNDISLLLKLGYDNEVISAVGKEKTQEILLEKDHLFVPESHKKPFGFCGKEFCDRNQIDSIKNKYRLSKRNIIIRLCLVAAIALMIFALNVFFEFFSNRVISFPTVVIFEMIFVGLLCVVINRQLINGAIGILKFETDLYSLLTFLVLTYLLYDVFAIITYFFNKSTVSASDLMLFGGPIAVYSLLVLITDLANCIRELKVFGIISSADSFYIAEKQNSAQLSKFGKDTEGTAEDCTYRIRKTSLVSGYFKKMSQSRINSVNLIYILGIVPTVSVIVGCCCLLLGDNFLRCASSMLLSVIMCIPFSYIFIRSLTEFVISSKLNEEKVAFIGTESIAEYASTKNLIFKDIDSIEITSCSEIQPNKRSIVQSDVEIAHRVFKALKGPLSTVKKSQDIDGTYDRSEVIINDIQDNGIEIHFESSMNILIGDKPYMQSHNIKVKTDTNLNAATKGVDRSVIYIAYDGIPKLGFIVNSKIKGGFANIADLLEQNDIHIFVETYEPQINDLYYEQNKIASLSNVNVIKPQTFESDDENQSGNGGLISSSSSVSLAKAICASKKIIEQRKQNRFLNILVSGIGGIFACLFMILTSTLNYLPFFDFLRLHSALIFNVIALSAMIPGIVRLIKLNNDDSIIK